MSLLVTIRVRPDRRGEAWIRMPPLEEGAHYLRVGPGLHCIRERLNALEPDAIFVYDLDFALVEAQQRQLGLLDQDRRLSIYDFPHPAWVHDRGVFCSECLVPEVGGLRRFDEIFPEDRDDDDAPDDSSEGDPFAEECAEDLREDVPHTLIEHHADCATCGRDFILSKRQAWEQVVGIAESLVCPECMDKIR